MKKSFFLDSFFLSSKFPSLLITHAPKKINLLLLIRGFFRERFNHKSTYTLRKNHTKNLLFSLFFLVTKLLLALLRVSSNILTRQTSSSFFTRRRRAISNRKGEKKPCDDKPLLQRTHTHTNLITITRKQARRVTTPQTLTRRNCHTQRLGAYVTLVAVITAVQCSFAE